MTIVHEKPTGDYDTFIQDGSILSKVTTVMLKKMMTMTMTVMTQVR